MAALNTEMLSPFGRSRVLEATAVLIGNCIGLFMHTVVPAERG